MHSPPSRASTSFGSRPASGRVVAGELQQLARPAPRAPRRRPPRSQAVCDEPPASVPAGRSVSPCSKVTCSSGSAQPLGGVLRLHRGGAHAHLVAGRLHHRAPVGGRAGCARAARHAVVGIGGGRHAHADQPFAVAPARRASDRAGPSRTARRRRDRPSRGGARRSGAGGRVLLGLDAAPQLDRVHGHLVPRARPSRIPARTCRPTRRARA